MNRSSRLLRRRRARFVLHGHLLLERDALDDELSASLSRSEREVLRAAMHGALGYAYAACTSLLSASRAFDLAIAQWRQTLRKQGVEAP